MNGYYSEAEIARQRSDWRERLESLGPLLRSQTAEHERLRRLSDASVAALRDHGAFEICAPEEVGGQNLHPVAQMEAFAGIVSHDSASGWCAMIGSHESAWLASRLPQAGLEEAFAGASERWPVTAGSIAPDGAAEQVEGGWQVSGRWGWGSGIWHADWVLGMCRITGAESQPGAPPPLVLAALPRDQVIVEDTWDALGMRGTGSSHYRFDDVVAPERFVLAGFERPPLRGGGGCRCRR